MLLRLVDALIITGGADLRPALYGQEPHKETGPAQEVRDAYELTLVRAALELDLPILGVCRGSQILNIAYGGSLEQHLPDILGHKGHLRTPGIFAEHEVRLVPGSLVERTVGALSTRVKSHHHQGFGQVGEGLQATGWATDDGIIEALEDPEHSFVLGVLWHPEADERSKIIGALVDEASAKRLATVREAGCGSRGGLNKPLSSVALRSNGDDSENGPHG
jgi:putative glutamine amidotransferase